MDPHNATVWEGIADAIPEEFALIHGERRTTWAAFEDRAARLATGLRSLGVTKDTKVAIDLFNCSEWLETLFGVLKIRAVPVSINFRYLEDELCYLFDNSDAEVAVFHRSLRDRVLAAASRTPGLRGLIEVTDAPAGRSEPTIIGYEELIGASARATRIERSPDDLMLFYTGGTTGMPKGVESPIGAYMRSVEMASTQLRGMALRGAPPDAVLTDLPDDPVDVAVQLAQSGGRVVGLAASPLMHNTAMGFAAAPVLRAGGSVVTLEGRSFDAHELFTTIERERVNVIALVGDAFARPMVRALDEHKEAQSPYDASSLRIIYSAGASFSSDTKQRLLEHVPQLSIVEYCGSSEGAFIGFKTVKAGDEESTARFLAGPGLKILDAKGDPIPEGREEPGLIASPTGMRGYYKDPEKTKEHFRDFDGIPHIVTGDYAVLMADGTVVLLGRGSSVVNTGGEKVFPEEVEDTIKRIPNVLDCVVVGVPDDRLGEHVAAVVEINVPDPDPGTIIDWAKQFLAAYKAPKEVVFSSVPRMPNGKPDIETARLLVIGARSSAPR